MKREDYLAKKKQDKQEKIDAGLVSERFPDVSGIVIQMKYYRGKLSPLPNPVQMLRTINFFPTSYAYFHMGCLTKECVKGGFDLASVVGSMVKSHKKMGKGDMFCGRKNSSVHSHHTSISYEIGIQYK